MDALGVKTLSELQAVPADKLVQVMATARFKLRRSLTDVLCRRTSFDPVASPLCADRSVHDRHARATRPISLRNPTLDPIDDARLKELLKGNFEGLRRRIWTGW